MNKKTENDDLRIIYGSLKKLLKLDEQERKLHKAQKKELDTIHNVMKRCRDHKGIKQNDEATKLLRQAEQLVSNLRRLLRK